MYIHCHCIKSYSFTAYDHTFHILSKNDHLRMCNYSIAIGSEIATRQIINRKVKDVKFDISHFAKGYCQAKVSTLLSW